MSDPRTWGVSNHALSEMRPYQIDGVRFLTRPIEELRKTAGYNIKGCLVGDQMGTGKSMQTAIAAQIMTPADGTIVVAAPASLTLNWRDEIKKWIGEDQSVFVVKSGKDVVPKDARWVVMSYEQIPKFRSDILARKPFSLIIDEAVNIKTAEADRSRAMLALAQHVDVSKNCRLYILNGTPIANRLHDLVVPLQALGHRVVEDLAYFRSRYCFSGLNDSGRPTYNGALNVDELRRKLEDVYIERLRKHVLPELKPVNRRMIAVTPDTNYFVDYKKELARRQASLSSGNSGEILAAITALRTSAALAKMRAAADIIEQTRQANPGEKLVVFSYYPEVLRTLAEQVNTKSQGEAIVLDGSVAPTRRHELVRQFQERENPSIIFGQIQAAGFGENMTSGNHVCFVDFDWRAYVHLQAEDRVNRIGQKRDVTVTYLHAPGTIDDLMLPRLEYKLEISNQFSGRTDEGNAFRDMVLNEAKLADQRDEQSILKAIASELTGRDKPQNNTRPLDVVASRR